MTPHSPAPSSGKKRCIPCAEHLPAPFEYFIMTHVAEVVTLPLLYFVLRPSGPQSE